MMSSCIRKQVLLCSLLACPFTHFSASVPCLCLCSIFFVSAPHTPLIGTRLVYEICTYLKRSRQLGTEGLFRKSGNASRVRMLQQHLDAYGRLPAKDIKQHKYTCHDMVQVLKAFLRHLPGVSG